MLEKIAPRLMRTTQGTTNLSINRVTLHKIAPRFSFSRNHPLCQQYRATPPKIAPRFWVFTSQLKAIFKKTLVSATKHKQDPVCGPSFFFLVTKSLGGFGSGHHQGQGTPLGSKGTYRGTYRSLTNTALTSAEGIEHTTFCKEVVRSLPTEPTCMNWWSMNFFFLTIISNKKCVNKTMKFNYFIVVLVLCSNEVPFGGYLITFCNCIFKVVILAAA